MSSWLVCIGRFLFFGLLGRQAFLLASYPAEYKYEDGFYGLVLLYVPAMCLWLYIMWDDKHLPWLYAVWICYILGFVIFILIIFAGDKPLEDKLDEAKVFGPNNLKMTLPCPSDFVVAFEYWNRFQQLQRSNLADIPTNGSGSLRWS